MEITLRGYQQKFVDDVQAKFAEGVRRIVGVAPCGSGKTVIAAQLIRLAVNDNKRCLFIVHRRELIEQTAKTFFNFNIDHGIILSGVTPQYDLPVQIAGIQTLVRRLDAVGNFDFIICDEAHHIAADSYKKVMSKSNALLLGLTATPERMGGVTLHGAFDAMVESVSVKTLIRDGYLSHYKYFVPDPAENFRAVLNSVKVLAGDYQRNQLESLMSRQIISAEIIKAYFARAKLMQSICYCVNINHSKLMAERFREYGIRAVHIDGNTPRDERRSIIDQFRAGEITVLCNAELFGEGFDVPAMECVILARPTKSLTLFIQQSMRALRPKEGKTAIILDCVGNYKEHGLPDDERVWSLEANPNKNPRPKLIKRCPKCGLICHANVTVCPTCGHKFESAEKNSVGRKQIVDRTVEFYSSRKADLNKTETRMQAAWRKQQRVAQRKGYRKAWIAYTSVEKFARSYEDCVEIEKMAGYKSGWGYYRWLEIRDNRNS